jgi:aryl-alcohol dehydrogenase-like predicted oxidoreductase
MRTRVLGRTGLEVSELIFGCGDVGGLLVRGEQAEMDRAVTRAIQSGCNWFDTASAYGGGKSEESLGRILPGIAAKPHVSTKVRLDVTKLDDVAVEVARSVDASLKRLRRTSVDLLQFHNAVARETGGRAIAEREVLKSGGVADALHRMREQGATRFVGFTALGEAPACRRVIESGRFDAAQVYYNMLNPSAARAMPAAWTGQDFGQLLAACRAQKMGVIAIRVLGAGILATDARHGREVMLTSDTAVAEEERKAAAVFRALGPARSSAARCPRMLSTSSTRSTGAIFATVGRPASRKLQPERAAVARHTARLEMGGQHPGAGVGHALEEFAPRLARKRLVLAVAAVPLRVHRLDRVVHHVADRDGRILARGDAHRDVTGRVAGRGLERDAVRHLVVHVHLHHLAGADHRQDAVVVKVAVERRPVIAPSLERPHLGLVGEVFGVREGRHPLAVVEARVPACVIDMQMSAEDGVDVPRREPGAGEVVEERKLGVRPFRARTARLVVADAGVDQDVLAARAQHEPLRPADEGARLGVEMARHHPAVLGLERLLGRVGVEVKHLEQGPSVVDHRRDSDVADPDRLHRSRHG